MQNNHLFLVFVVPPNVRGGGSSRLGQNPNFYRIFFLEAPVTPFPHISSTNYQHYGHLLKNIENIIDQCDHPAFSQKKIQPSRKMARAQMRPWQVTPQSFLSEVFHQV